MSGPFSCAFKKCIVITIQARDDLHIHKHSKAMWELQSLLCNIKLKKVLGWRACPKDVHILIPRTSGYIALYTNRNLAYVTKELKKDGTAVEKDIEHLQDEEWAKQNAGSYYQLVEIRK